ncbi:MAG: spermidine/putrescine ABC transporter substrate-binding protein [Gammaproteobacteria bacterium]|nr:spermidine/putrescine ABC transporter substrate-binding protein [Gammaproteobacteria bacterium]
MRLFFFLISLFFSNIILASDKVVNVYVWGGEIPQTLIHQFEKETGIHVNFSTYDNNETLYAKLHASNQAIYDVILPSTYFVERLKKQGFLKQLDHARLPHFKNLDAAFLDAAYDPKNKYSVPFIWGATGIFYNQHWVKDVPKAWHDLWSKTWRNRLMLLDDPREVFSIALLSLGYSPNDSDANHIKAAFESLKALVPNIKLFASESIQAILIDEDAHIGSAWNGDGFKAHQENVDVQFVFPEEGFLIWVDCLSMLNNAPHPDEAYAFIDFLLEAKHAATVALSEGHAITNQAGKALLPKSLRNNPMVYPSPDVLNRGVIQRDLSEKSLALYDTYWQQFKFSF